VRLRLSLRWCPAGLAVQYVYRAGHLSFSLARRGCSAGAPELQRLCAALASQDGDFRVGNLLRLPSQLQANSPDGGFHRNGNMTVDLHRGHFEVSVDGGATWSPSSRSLQEWVDWGNRSDRPHLTIDTTDDEVLWDLFARGPFDQPVLFFVCAPRPWSGCALRRLRHPRPRHPRPRHPPLQHLRPRHPPLQHLRLRHPQRSLMSSRPVHVCCARGWRLHLCLLGRGARGVHEPARPLILSPLLSSHPIYAEDFGRVDPGGGPPQVGRGLHAEVLSDAARRRSGRAQLFLPGRPGTHEEGRAEGCCVTCALAKTTSRHPAISMPAGSMVVLLGRKWHALVRT